MLLIEPCCAPKHLLSLRESLGEDGTSLWHGYGDLSLSELLPALLLRYVEADMILVAPFLPDQASEALRTVMLRQRARMDGKGHLNLISHLTLITDLSQRRSPMASAWLKANPFDDRLTLRNLQQNDTAIVLPDLALYGAINLAYGHHFTATATKNARTITSLRDMYDGLR